MRKKLSPKTQEKIAQDKVNYDLSVTYLKKTYGLDPGDVSLPSYATPEIVDIIAWKHDLQPIKQ